MKNSNPDLSISMNTMTLSSKTILVAALVAGLALGGVSFARAALTECGEAGKERTLEQWKACGIAHADKNLTELATLRTEVTAATSLDASLRDDLLNRVVLQNSNVTYMKNQISQAATLEAVRPLARALLRDYRISGLFRPQVSIMIAAGNAKATIATLTSAQSALTVRVDGLEDDGVDVAGMRAQLATLAARITSAGTYADAAHNGVKDLVADKGDAAIIASNKQAIFKARADLVVARTNITEARAAAEAVRTLIAAAKPGSDIKLQAAPQGGVAPVTVVFTAKSEDKGTHTVDFGDGQSEQMGKQLTATHTYVTPGTYTAKLSVSGKGVVDSVKIQINAGSSQYKATPTSGKAPLTVAFEGPLPGDEESQFVEFGDGATSTMVRDQAAGKSTASHTYTSMGTYTAKFKRISACIEASCTASSTTKQVGTTTITVLSATATSTITATPASGSQPLTVTFAVQSNHEGNKRLEFGDGQAVALGTGLTATHVYTNVGTYQAKLKVGGADGTVVATTSVIVRALGSSGPTIATVEGPTTVTTSASSTWTVKPTENSDALQYAVLWGDEPYIIQIEKLAEPGPFQSSRSFSHKYAEPGVYNPRFTLKDETGALSHLTITVIVIGAGTQ